MILGDPILDTPYFLVDHEQWDVYTMRLVCQDIGPKDKRYYNPNSYIFRFDVSRQDNVQIIAIDVTRIDIFDNEADALRCLIKKLEERLKEVNESLTEVES